MSRLKVIRRGDLDWRPCRCSPPQARRTGATDTLGRDFHTGSGSNAIGNSTTLVSACGSKVLLDAHAAVYDKYLRYQMILVVFRGEAAAVEHKKPLGCGPEA